VRPGEPVAEYAVGGLEWSVHCPPVTLSEGEWTGRFRAVHADGTAGAWSRARSFRVPADTTTLALPPRDELLARIPDEHPRPFLRPEDLPDLRDAVAGRLRTRFERLRARCDALVADPPPTAEPEEYTADMPRKSEAWRERWWGNRRATIRALESAATLAFAWRVAGDEEYCALARRLLLEAAAWDPRGATGYRYNDEAGMPYAYHSSRAYRFLHPLLDEDELEACRAVMRVRGREMYAHLAPRHMWRPYSSHSNRAWHLPGDAAGRARHCLPRRARGGRRLGVVRRQPVRRRVPGLVGRRRRLARGQRLLDELPVALQVVGGVQRAALGLDAYALAFFASAGEFALYTGAARDRLRRPR